VPESTYLAHHWDYRLDHHLYHHRHRHVGDDLLYTGVSAASGVP
jgi:hypothetical protein